MDRRDQTALLVLLGLGALALFLMSQQPAATPLSRLAPLPTPLSRLAPLPPGGTPVLAYENEETWTLERDPRSGRLSTITIHRDARSRSI